MAAAQPITPITIPHRSLKAHESLVASVAIFSDGRRMVTGSYDKTLRMWDLTTTVVLKKMEGHRSRVEAVAVSVDGKWVASGDWGGKFIVWDGDTGEPLTQAIKGHSKRITSLDFSPDSGVLATASLDKVVKLWRTETWDAHEKPLNSGETINCVRYSPDGKLLALATSKCIQIWSQTFSQRSCVANFKVGNVPAPYISLAWTPDGTCLFSGGSRSNPIIQEWDASTWKQLGDPWSGHTDRINAISVNYNGTLIASASRDNHVRLWRLSDRRIVAIFKLSQSSHCSSFSADGKHILSGCRDASVTEWTVPEDTQLSDAPMLDNDPGTPTNKLVEAHDTIRKVIEVKMDDIPIRLFNTSTGHLCDREAQINSFKGCKEYKKLLSLTMKQQDANIKLRHIRDMVAKFFSFVMLSHRWETREASLHEIQDNVIYELQPVGGIAKLQSFCKVVRDAGYRWAWIDTCCIDQKNYVEVQRSVNSMFAWYRHSALTVIYMSDVPSSSKSGAMARSTWVTRGWTIMEILAPKIVLFYQQDWTLYLDDHSFNHKDSTAIMRELADATGIDPQALAEFHPGMIGIREKLQWASRRVTTLPEDVAYSLFGLFGVHLPVIYGEQKQNALGRLLQEIVGRSGDISCLDWVGKSSEFNSCLPANITCYAVPPSVLLSLSEEEVEMAVSSLRDAGAAESASQLYATLDQLSAPRFARRRLHLPCIVFAVTEITRKPSHDQESYFTYAIKANRLNDLLITTEDKLVTFSRRKSIQQEILLIRPWDRHLMELDITDDDAQSIMTEDSVTPPSTPIGDNVSVDSEYDSKLRALRLLVRLGQPFRAFLLTQEWDSLGGYKRIAADCKIIARVTDTAAGHNFMDTRTLEILGDFP